MSKNKAKDGIVVNAGNGNYIPNIVRGGAAIPIGKKNFYYMQGRKHEQGGIDVGRNAKTGLEVEGEEVMQVTPNEVRVYSSVPFLRGVSPAELVLNGADANKVFAAQEKYKDNNRINDDGIKYRTGGNIYKQNVKTVVADNTNINKPIIFDTVERIVSSSDKLNVPIWSKGVKWYDDKASNAKDMIVSIGDNNLDWQMINQHGTFVNDIKKAASRRTPIYNGIVNNTPSNLFEYYRRYPIIGYRNITNGEPTIPITGLDAIANNLNDKNKKQYGGSKTNNMRKLVSINGNVKNGLIHTPNQDVLAYNKERKPRFNGRYSKPGLHNLELLAADLLLPKGKVNIEPDVPKRLGWVEAHNRLVGADIFQKPLDAKKDNTNVVHTISETERRTRKFVCGGRSKAKVGKEFRINNDKYNIGDTITYKDKQYVVTDRNEAKPINKKLDNYVDGVTGAARKISTSPQLTRNITNGLVNNTPTYKKNGETHYFVEAPKVDYDSGTSLADLQNLLNLTPRKGSNQSSSSSTEGVNNRTSKSAKPTIQRVNRLAPATNAEMAGIRRGLEPLLQNTIVDKLNKTVDNDLNVMPVQDDVAKTRNMDNILLGVNLGSSVLDAVMGNIYANQMHGYTAPNITAPIIENPGEIKLNEEDLKDIPAPILMAATKLKTRYNANPQLSKIEDDTRRIMSEIGRNTSNSRVALARKQRAALQGQQAKNEVYGRKENIETELINKDKLNQQEVTARNLARYDQYNQALAAQRANRARLRLAADTANIQNKLAVSTANAQLKSQADRFNTANKINQLVHQAGIDAAKAEARSNIFSGMLGNIGSALNTWNRNKRQAKLDEETLRVLGLLAPNANKLVLSALGY